MFTESVYVKCHLNYVEQNFWKKSQSVINQTLQYLLQNNILMAFMVVYE